MENNELANQIIYESLTSNGVVTTIDDKVYQLILKPMKPGRKVHALINSNNVWFWKRGCLQPLFSFWIEENKFCIESKHLVIERNGKAHKEFNLADPDLLNKVFDLSEKIRCR